ncbi:MAG: trigger factor [Methylotenera sp.]|jgi:trigger factor|uniref:Trigger factor n=1 Tax=Methylotenera mobilis TaxID=359408 RepID=A0A351R908_9PROT|nr:MULTISPECIES: trigger factor [Methylotenera]HBA08529.1 trigger factor [Methylotenera mobilis]MDP3210707.1 trigger factor [Methylotenera sp.]MDP3776731.1 trigger factor [Methylotenera sp.]PPC99490.1 MAG: trigger factor [Methylotenera sp.]PPD48741.1 MAG: trigger factor [Methylotenera sp.]
MALNVETLSNLERRISISVPLQPLEAQIKQRLNQVARTAKFSGFRPGKAPMGLVNQHYGNQVRDEVYSAAVEKSFGEAVDEAKLRVAGFPNIQHKPFDAASETLEYTATFEVFPEVVVGDLSKVKIERPVLEVGEADVKKTLDVLVKQRVKFEPVKRAAKKGDRVNVTLKAFIDGEEVESTGDNGIDLVLGEAGRMATFDDELIGGKTGATKKFDITYPEDHNPAQLAGKAVGYEVTFVSVSQPVLPEIDADFAKSLGVEDGDVEKMKAEVAESLKQEVAKRVSAKLKEQVFQALVESADFEVPRILLETEINRMMQTTEQNLKQRGADLANIKLEPAMFEDQAKRSTKLRLLLGELINTNGLHANADQVRAMVDVFSQSFERPADVVTWYYADHKRLDEPAALATEENAVSWVLSQAKVTDKKVKFDDLMGNA